MSDAAKLAKYLELYLQSKNIGQYNIDNFGDFLKEKGSKLPDPRKPKWSSDGGNEAYMNFYLGKLIGAFNVDVKDELSKARRGIIQKLDWAAGLLQKRFEATKYKNYSILENLKWYIRNGDLADMSLQKFNKYVRKTRGQHETTRKQPLADYIQYLSLLLQYYQKVPIESVAQDLSFTPEQIAKLKQKIAKS